MDRGTDVHRRRRTRSRNREPRCLVFIETVGLPDQFSLPKGERGLPRSRQEPEIGGLIKTRRALNAGQAFTARGFQGNSMETNTNEAARAAVAASLIMVNGFFAGRREIIS